MSKDQTVKGIIRRIITLGVIPLIAFTTLGVAFAILTKPTTLRSHNTLRNNRIVGSIEVIRDIMDILYVDKANYDSYSCTHKYMDSFCQTIDRNYGMTDGKEPVIVHDAPSQSQMVCVYSPLNLEKGHLWYCADSSGRAGYTGIDPGTGYCVEGESAVCPPVSKEMP